MLHALRTECKCLEAKFDYSLAAGMEAQALKRALKLAGTQKLHPIAVGSDQRCVCLHLHFNIYVRKYKRIAMPESRGVR